MCGRARGGESADKGVRVLQGAGASPARAPGPVRIAPREGEGGKERVASGETKGSSLSGRGKRGTLALRHGLTLACA